MTTSPETHPVTLPRPTWRTRATNWVFGLKPADVILKRRACDLVKKLNLAQYLVPHGVYVDIGSGTGHIPAQIARAARGLHSRFLCIEPVSKPTKRVLKRVQERTDGHVQFTRAVGDRLPLADRTANAVSAFFVLHHIPYAIQLGVLSEMKRVLKPDGLVFLWEDTPENDQEYLINEVWDRRLNFEPKDEPHYYRTGDDWQKLFADLGFTPITRTHYEDYSPRKNEGTIRHTGFVLKKQ